MIFSLIFRVRIFTALIGFLLLLTLNLRGITSFATEKAPIIAGHVELEQSDKANIWTFYLDMAHCKHCRWEVVYPESGLKTLDYWMNQDPQIVLAVNGGYFDPANGMSTSVYRRKGKLLLDPAMNPRLMGNPSLAPYLDKILHRTEWRQLACGEKTRYQIVSPAEIADSTIPPGCQEIEALAVGPRLLPNVSDAAEGFTARKMGRLVRDPIGVSARNARTALGLTADGQVVLMLVMQTSQKENSGLSLDGVAAAMKKRGVVSALALDGGSSSSLAYRPAYFLHSRGLNSAVDGAVNKKAWMSLYAKRQRDGQVVVRPLKSVFVLRADF
ncbi:MAG: phosphodiester glycosidase family protein [Cyanobacteria bacterium]|nr:phosphodiester glycosidase family protein [Cyanobacteriota bacterium]